MQAELPPGAPLDVWPEIRSALHAIDGFTFALLRGLEGPLTGEQRAALTVVRRNARQLLRIAGAVLDLTDLNRGKLRLRRQLIDAARLLGEVATELAEPGQRCPAALITVAPHDLPPVRGDLARLRRALSQLAAAALQRCDARAWIAARRCGSGVEIAVGPFADGDRLEEGRRAGESLALALARRVIELHGARLRWSAENGGELVFRLRADA